MPRSTRRVRAVERARVPLRAPVSASGREGSSRMPAQAAAFAPAELAAMRRALTIAAAPGVPLGPNPRVGCVLLDADRRGGRRGPPPRRRAPARRGRGAAAWPLGRLRATGLTAVVTLEPCNHTGRTGPCAAGAARGRGHAGSCYAQSDPNPVAAGGAAPAARRRGRGRRRAARRRGARAQPGLDVRGRARPPLRDLEARHLPRRAQRRRRRHLPLGQQRRRAPRHPPAARAECDVVLAGTGTVLVDDPRLTVRDEADAAAAPRAAAAAGGHGAARPAGRPPRARRRRRDRPPPHPRPARGARRAARARPAPRLPRGRARTWPRPSSSAGLVDEVIAYVAPMLLGGGHARRRGPRVATLADARRLDVVDVTVLGDGPTATCGCTMTPARAHRAPPTRRRTEHVHRHRRGARHRRRPGGPGRRVRLTVRGPLVVEDAALGDSIAVNGCCLTVAERDRGRLHRRRHARDAGQDRPRRPARRAAGSTSSAPSPRPPGSAATSSRATSTPPARSASGRPASTGSSSRSTFPADLARYLVEKGSVTVDGVSPHRRRRRRRRGHLHRLAHPRDPRPHHARPPPAPATVVNLEVDVIAKYVERMLAHGTHAPAARDPTRQRTRAPPGRTVMTGHEGIRLDAVEEAVADIAAGTAVVVVDDEDRENEGDIIFAASKATPELMAFTIRHSSGVICAPMPGDDARPARDPADDPAQPRPDAHGVHDLGRRPRRRQHRHQRRRPLAHRAHAGRLGDRAVGDHPPRPRVPAALPRGRRAGPPRPHRGRRRPGPDGRAHPGRRARRGRQRRRHDEARPASCATSPTSTG